MPASDGGAVTTRSETGTMRMSAPPPPPPPRVVVVVGGGGAAAVAAVAAVVAARRRRRQPHDRALGAARPLRTARAAPGTFCAQSYTPRPHASSLMTTSAPTRTALSLARTFSASR